MKRPCKIAVNEYSIKSASALFRKNVLKSKETDVDIFILRSTTYFFVLLFNDRGQIYFRGILRFQVR